MRVLGIDPGTWTAGYGLLSSNGELGAEDWGVISFKAKTPLEQRLYGLYSSALEIIRLRRPDEMAIEDPFMGRGQHRFTGPAFALGQAQASVMIAAAGEGIAVYRYSPAEVKLAVADYGRASKEQVQELLAAQLGIEPKFEKSDAADALAVALCHLRRRQATNLMSREIEPEKWMR